MTRNETYRCPLQRFLLSSNSNQVGFNMKFGSHMCSHSMETYYNVGPIVVLMKIFVACLWIPVPILVALLYSVKRIVFPDHIIAMIPTRSIRPCFYTGWQDTSNIGCRWSVLWWLSFTTMCISQTKPTRRSQRAGTLLRQLITTWYVSRSVSQGSNKICMNTNSSI